MNADLENLIVLQAQDLELGRLRTELAEAPRRVLAADTAQKSAEVVLERCRSRIAEEEKLRRGQEAEVGTQKAKQQRLSRSLDGATNAQQVAAFEHEIAFAANSIEELEEAELASMERTELLETERMTAEAGLERTTATLSGEREGAAALKQGHEATIAGVERERSALRAQVDAVRLSSYDRLTKTRGTAVAEALGNATSGKCAACQMGVRPQRWQDLIGRDHMDEIFSCETCGRMLFWDPRRDTPKTWSAGDRFRSAQAGAAASGGVSAKAGGTR